MSLAPYTTPEEVRAALGVNSTELPNKVILLPLYRGMLDESLDSFNPLLVPLYEAFTQQGFVGTPDQKRFVRVMNLFALYTVCKVMMSNVSMFAVRSLTDGKAEFERQVDVFDSLRAGVQETWMRLGGTLTALLPILDPGVVPAVQSVPTLMLVSVPATDPVTGGATGAV